MNITAVTLLALVPFGAVAAQVRIGTPITPTTPRIDTRQPISSTRASDVFFGGTTNFERGQLNSKNPAYIIARDIELAGWLVQPWWHENDDPAQPLQSNPHFGAVGSEDYHYSIFVDPDFIAARYGPASPLASAMRPGRPGNVPLFPREIPLIGQTEDAIVDPSRRIPFADAALDGTSRGVTANSFYAIFDVFDAELNAWYAQDYVENGKVVYKGRGPAPAGWFKDPADSSGNLWWPFNPMNPDGRGVLKPGDYVVIRGTLWEDGGHVKGWFCGTLGGFFCAGQEQQACWNRGEIPPDPPAWPAPRPVAEHGGWIEIHPVDFIYRSSPAANPPRTSRMVALCAPVGLIDASRTIDVKLTPQPSELPKTSGYVLRVQELIDGRYTDVRTIDEHSVLVAGDTAVVHVKVHSSGTASFQAKEGRFKAAYLLWWEPPPPPLKTLLVSMTPAAVSVLDRTTTVTVHAEDAITHGVVVGTVNVEDIGRGQTDQTLALTLCVHEAGPRGTARLVVSRRVSVTAPGYAEALVDFRCPLEQ